MAEVATNGSAAAATEAPAAPAPVPPPAPVAFTALKVQVTVAAGLAEQAVAFYKAAFAAEEVARSTHLKRKGEAAGDDPALLSAELRVGAAALLVRDQAGDDVSAVGGGASGIVLRLETGDVKAAVAQAATAGATLQGEITEDEDGLAATLVDPYGVTWFLASGTSAKKSA